MHESIWNNITHSMNCSDISYGDISCKCTKCSHIRIIDFPCKSRFCNSYGKIYAQNLALKLKDESLNVKYIHALFSFPT